jgi:non-ribosomal peptide synthase protein (TIGR01720 family)
VLLDDLAALHRLASKGEPLKLPPKMTSFKKWSECLQAYAHSPELLAERAYWESLRREVPPALPRDSSGPNTEASSEYVRMMLDETDARALVEELPQVFGMQINEVLLTAVTQAFEDWTGQPRLLIDLEGHGREDLFEKESISRTVGWFTSLYPVVLDVSGAEDPGVALRTVKEHLRAIPNKGVGFGVLRHITGLPELRSMPAAEVSFNYLGQFDGGSDETAMFTLASESVGEPRSNAGARTHLIGISATVVGGRMSLLWSYSSLVHERSTIESLAQTTLQRLRDLVAFCRNAEVSYTPSDFPLAGIDQQALDDILDSVSGGDA